MTAKTIAKIVPGVMSLALVGESLKPLKDFGKGEPKPKKIFKSGLTILVGVPIIGAVSKQVNLLP